MQHNPFNFGFDIKFYNSCYTNVRIRIFVFDFFRFRSVIVVVVKLLSLTNHTHIHAYICVKYNCENRTQTHTKQTCE